MATYTQADRPLKIATPLGPDDLLLTGFSGQEAISQLFTYQLDLVAENKTEVAFDKLMGQGVTVSLELPNGKARYFAGICSRFSEGRRDSTFTHYRMEMVPPLWLLTRRVQSRIFQHVAVPDILKKVLSGLDVAWEVQGPFQPRDYCAQYNETDHAFASRLMEEEGIYYFFKHSKDGHKLVVANSSQSHSDLPEQSKVIFEETTGGVREVDMRITEWEKVQELRSGKYTLWDHCFELPHKHLEADKVIVDAISVGRVKHKLLVNGNDKLEIYQYPGQYAQRFDGVDAGGGEKATEIPKIFDDNKRTVEIRMQQEALPSLVIRGVSDCRQFVSGHKFTLERHFNADGVYVLASVNHSAELAPDSRAADGDQMNYQNRFTCIPLALPFRPPPATPKPVMLGTQTAVVVGPPGPEEIFTDKYGRVKVQFHWDREGKYDPDSSCWIRVSTIWAGKGYGVFHLPRRGQEVIIAFEEGDVDRPIILGSVYNAEMMPAKGLPAGKKVSGMKSASNAAGGGYNEISFDDTHDNEQMTIHAQFDMTTVVENDESWTVHNNRTTQIDVNDSETVGGDQTNHVKGNRAETVDGKESIEIKTGREEKVSAGEKIKIDGGRDEKVDGGEKVEISGGADHKITGDFKRAVTGNYQLTATANIHTEASANWEGVGKAQASLQSPDVQIKGDSQVSIGSGGSTIVLTPGSIVLTSGGGQITIDGGGVTIVGTLVKIN